ncbi:hypothetical protein ACW9H6_27550 [Pseudomonas sp. SDO528_S397]
MPRGFNGAWKNANPDIVSEVASHLAAPDRLALSESGAMLREAMAQTNSIKASPSAIKAWSTLRHAPHTGALDTLLEHLPSAKALDKTAVAMEFVKSLSHLQSASQPDLKQLDHLYDALASVAETDPGKAIELVKGLFNYGIARLPGEQHAAGLERITDAIHGMAATIDPLYSFGELAQKRDKQQALTEVLGTAIQKLSLMPLKPSEKQRIGDTIMETSTLKYAGNLLHDFALNTLSPNFPLTDEHAHSALQTMGNLKNAPVKLDLAYELMSHFDQFGLPDKPAFLAQLEGHLQPLADQGIEPEKTAWLLENLKELQRTVATQANV